MFNGKYIIAIIAAIVAISYCVSCFSAPCGLVTVPVKCVMVCRQTDGVEDIVDATITVAALQARQQKRYNADREIALAGVFDLLEALTWLFDVYVIATNKWQTFFIINKEFISLFTEYAKFAPNSHIAYAPLASNDLYIVTGRLRCTQVTRRDWQYQPNS